VLPELIRQNRDEYVPLLKAVDSEFAAGNQSYLKGLHAFIVRLLDQQEQSASKGRPP
jgi:hypothetical protein